MHERDPMIEKVLEGLRKGLPEYAAAEAAGCSYPTWFRWQDEDPTLKLRKVEAKRYRIPLIEDALYKAALKGSVQACLAILEKEDIDWRNRAKELAPQQQTFVFTGGAAALLSLLPGEKRQKLLTAMVSQGLLPETVVDIGSNQPKIGNGDEGNGAGH